MDRALSLQELTRLLCRTGADQVLQAAFGIDEERVKRMRRDAAKDTTANTSHKKFGIATGFGTSKMSPSIPCPAGVKYEVRLDSIFLYRKGKDRFSQYTGSLPFGIQFGTPLAELKERLGQPLDERGGEVSPYLGVLPIRLKYDTGDCFVWFEFDNEEKVEMVTLVGYCYGTQ